MREIRLDQIFKTLVLVEGQQPKVVYRVLLGLYINGVVDVARVFEEEDIGVPRLQAVMQTFANEIIGQPKSVPIPGGIQPIVLPDIIE